MSNTPQQVVPIALSPNPVPANVTAATMSQLMQLIAQYMGATISANVSFIPFYDADPVSDVSTIIYNTTQNAFKYWSTATGSYQPVGILFTAVDDTGFIGPLIFNTSTQILEVWDGATNSYVWAGPPNGSVNPVSYVGLFFWNSSVNALMFWDGSAYVSLTVLPVTTMPVQNLGLLVLNTVTQDLLFYNAGAGVYQAINLQFNTSDPVTNAANTILNTTQNQLKFWNGSLYQSATGPVVLGDIKWSYVNADDFAHGWIILNNRTIDTTPGLAANQQANLHTLFGAGGAEKIPAAPSPTGTPTIYALVFMAFPGG